MFTHGLIGNLEWDSGIILRAGLGEPDAAAKLNATIAVDDAAWWARSSVADWAYESHALAASFIYKNRPDEGGDLPAGYQDRAAPIVKTQLEKAGIRLALMLNSALR
jgi:hypothetical protein